MLLNVSANLENSATATGMVKVSFHSNPKEGAVPPNVQATRQLSLILHASKVMLKILLARLQQYVNWEIPDVKAGFTKGRVTRYQVANIEEAREFQKDIYFCFVDHVKAFDCVDDNKLWKITFFFPQTLENS